jgi:hypothetical protein
MDVVALVRYADDKKATCSLAVPATWAAADRLLPRPCLTLQWRQGLVLQHTAMPKTWTQGVQGNATTALNVRGYCDRRLCCAHMASKYNRGTAVVPTVVCKSA